MHLRLAPLAVLLALPLPQQSAQLPQPRPPIFRAGAHYVRVDAYPADKHGAIIAGLTKDDFEIYEDGKLQTIEQAEFVTFDAWTPEGERKDPRSQQEAYDLAADPNYRVFVIVLDPTAYNMQGRHFLRSPLHQFIDRNLGARDLFGLLTTENEWTDLVLGQSTAAANAAIDSERWLDPDRLDERLWPYYACGLANLVGIKKLDDTYSLLEGLVKLLGLIRQERKAIVFVSNGLSSPGTSNHQAMGNAPPRVPRIGIENGRIGEVTHGDRIGGGPGESFCAAERMRLLGIDFRERFRDLLAAARQGNVAFYPVSPLGLQGLPFKERGGVDLDAFHAQNARADSLLTLASETDGIAIVNTNDLAGGMRRIAADIHAYYVLGYYTTNTKWDGRVRSIKVRLKPKRETIRARRQYRAPTAAEIAAFSTPPAPHVPSAEEIALGTLAPARPDLPFMTYAARQGNTMSMVIEVLPTATPWPAGTQITALAEAADGTGAGGARQTLKAAGRLAVIHVPLDEGRAVTAAAVNVHADGMVYTDRLPLGTPSVLVGDPQLFRNGTTTAALICSRSDAVRLEWSVLQPLDRSAVRLLDRSGKPLPIPLELRHNEAALPDRLVMELSLAPLARGEYLVELTAAAGTIAERKLLPLRIR